FPALPEQHLAPLDVDARDVGHEHPRVSLFSQDPPDRPCDLRRGQRGRRNLVQERLEQVMVATIDDEHVHRRRGERLGGLEPPEPGADDHDPRASCRPVATFAGSGIGWVRRRHSSTDVTAHWETGSSILSSTADAVASVTVQGEGSMFKKSSEDRGQATPEPPTPAPGAVRTRTVSVIGPTLVFKGELSADEDLVIQGTIEGTIAHHKKNLTVGKEGRVKA